MRIALFSEVFLPKIDGITNRLRNTIECLTELGHEVLVFAPSGSVRGLAGARVVEVPGLPFPPYPGLQVALPDPRITWELARFDPHVVHAVGPACLGVWGMLASRMLSLPMVASYHTDLPAYAPKHGLGFATPILWPLLRNIHNMAELNLCPSKHTRDELREHGIENVGLWRGGVDAELFHPRRRCLEMRARLTEGRVEKPLLLYAGRVSQEKNLPALEEVMDAHPGVHVAIVGDGPHREALERRFSTRPVTFAGFLRGEELATAFASADVFVMPSTTETLGFVALEAMSAGVPVVVANAGGLPQIVKHDENGLLFDPAVRGDFAEKVGELLDHHARRRFLARMGRKKAENSTWMGETKKLLNEYRKAMVLHRSRGRLGRLVGVLIG